MYFCPSIFEHFRMVCSLLPQNFHDFFFILGTRRCPCLVQCSPQVSCQFSFHNYGGSNFSSCTVRRNKTTKSNNKIDCKLPYSNCCALALCAQSTFYKYNKNISLGLNFFLRLINILNFVVYILRMCVVYILVDYRLFHRKPLYLRNIWMFPK